MRVSSGLSSLLDGGLERVEALLPTDLELGRCELPAQQVDLVAEFKDVQSHDATLEERVGIRVVGTNLRGVDRWRGDGHAGWTHRVSHRFPARGWRSHGRRT